MRERGIAKNSAVAGSVGAISGGFSKFFVYPMDTVKKRLQGQNFGSMVKLYSGPLDCGLKIIRDEGYRTLYRGVAPTLVKR